MKLRKAGILSSFVLAGSLVLGASNMMQAHAAQGISVTLDGKVVNFDQPPIMVNYRTLVPLRAIFEAFGAQVYWNNDTQTVTAVKGNTTITLQIGSNTVYKNGTAINLDVPGQVVNDRTLVPIRFISEALGENVSWDDNSATVIITTPAPVQQPQPVSQPTPPPQPPTNTQQTAEQIGKLSNRVVYIEVSDANGNVYGTASGFIVSSDGEIVTNYHVIKDASSAKITLSDQSTYTTSTLLNTDPSNDLAVLKINASNLPTVTLGDSNQITLGESVVAIGSPLGFKNTLSTGVVSSTSRNLDGINYIQTSAPIDHGSSGGALFDMNGKVIGVTSAGISSSSAELGLVIPSNTVSQLLQKPAINQTMSHKYSASDMQDYLNSNWSVATYKGHTFHFSYLVFNASDGKSLSIAASLSDRTELQDYLQLEQNDILVIPAFLMKMTEIAHQKAGGNPFMVLFFTYDTNTYPSTLPSNEVVYHNGIYTVHSPFAIGSNNYDTGQFSYIMFPDQGGQEQIINGN